MTYPDYDDLLNDEALQSSDWAELVHAALPSTLEDWNTEDDEDVSARERLEAICTEVLSSPRAIAHPDWGLLLRAVVELSSDYAELTEDAYYEALDPNDAANDEGGVVEMIVDAGLSTIEDAFVLLAIPEVTDRSDWPDLVRFTIETKAQRFGTSLFLSGGWEEADAMFATPKVQAHPEAAALWDEARRVFPLKGKRPAISPS